MVVVLVPGLTQMAHQVQQTLAAEAGADTTQMEVPVDPLVSAVQADQASSLCAISVHSAVLAASSRALAATRFTPSRPLGLTSLEDIKWHFNLTDRLALFPRHGRLQQDQLD